MSSAATTRDVINHPLPDFIRSLYYLIHPARMALAYGLPFIGSLFKKRKHFVQPLDLFAFL
jgi:hypothetical protein